MRFYLDTNALARLIERGRENMSDIDFVNSYEHVFWISSVVIYEFINISRGGEIDVYKKGEKRDVATLLFDYLNDWRIHIEPVRKEHFIAFAKLPFPPKHSDPFDRLIIAQAITDKIPLVSSDQLFVQYIEYGLDLYYSARQGNGTMKKVRL